MKKVYKREAISMATFTREVSKPFVIDSFRAALFSKHRDQKAIDKIISTAEKFEENNKRINRERGEKDL